MNNVQRIVYPALLFLVFAAYLLAGRLGIMAHTNPVEMDTISYLRQSLEIKETGGPQRHIQNSIQGIYRGAIQHPLYMLFLSPFGENNIRFFIRAKILTFWIGFAFLAVYFYLARRLLGTFAALVALSLTVFNATFLRLTTMVASESLLAIFFLAAWYTLARGFQNQKYWPLAGAFSGLAFLSKSTAILLLPIFVLSVVARYRRQCLTLLKNKYFWAFFLVFFTVASPLLIRNVRVYGKIFYSESSPVMWMDRWHEFHNVKNKEIQPSLSRYLKEHTPGEIAGIFLEGLFVRDRKMLVDGLKPFAFWRNPLEIRTLQGFYQQTIPLPWLWAVFLIGLSVFGLWKERAGPWATVTLVAAGVFLIFMGWFSKIFPGTPPTRFLYPIFFLIFLYAARGLQAAAGRFLSGGRMASYPGAPAAALGLFLLFYIYCLFSHFDWKTLDIKKSYQFNPVVGAQLLWANKNLGTDEKILVGKQLYTTKFYFLKGIRPEMVLWPIFDDMHWFRRYLKENDIRYCFLDLATIVHNWELYGDYFYVSRQHGLKVKRPLPDFMEPLPMPEKLKPAFRLYKIRREAL